MASVPKTIGRGGAGNFRSDSDRAAAETPATPDTRTVTQSSIRSGRGGAGNINTPSTTSTSTSGPSPGESPAARPAARRDGVIVEAPKSAAAPVVYGGRGGVGNWKVGREEEEERRRGEEEGRRREVEEAVRREVEGVGGLKVPGRVYRGVGRGEEGVEDV